MVVYEKGQGSDRLSNLGELGVKLLRDGEENRAKDAKDAKVKGMKDEAIAGGVVDWVFGLDKELGRGWWGTG